MFFPFFYLRISEKSRTFALVIELEQHIEILLLSNDCVIVPDLGGFVAHHIDARYDEDDHTFVPPIRTLGFNPQLKMNDSLLVQSYIEAYDISYPEALRRIEDEVAELRSHLETAGFYELTDIGILRLNREGNLEFEPCEAGILTPSLYGLSSFAIEQLVPKAKITTVPKAQQVKAEDSLPDESAITIKMSWLRNAVAVAAAFIAFIMIGTPVSNSDKRSDVRQSSFITTSVPHSSAKNVQEPTPAQKATPSDQPQTNIAASEESPLTQDIAIEENQENKGGVFCIVMASQVTERNANTFVSILQEQGYPDARIIISGPKKIRRVVYGSYISYTEAASTLQQLRKKSRLFRETWVMEIK